MVGYPKPGFIHRFDLKCETAANQGHPVCRLSLACPCTNQVRYCAQTSGGFRSGVHGYQTENGMMDEWKRGGGRGVGWEKWDSIDGEMDSLLKNNAARPWFGEDCNVRHPPCQPRAKRSQSSLVMEKDKQPQRKSRARRTNNLLDWFSYSLCICSPCQTQDWPLPCFCQARPSHLALGKGKERYHSNSRIS